MTIHGSCHCGNITFGLDWEPDPVTIPARECGCSFCVKHGGVWTSNPRGRLAVHLRDASRRSLYAFGTGTASFHVCSVCGVVPVVTSEIDGCTYAVVNVNALTDIDRTRLERVPVSFDGESLESRLARRTRGWIADVRFTSGADAP